tara:strand:+ start:28 stop:483 length:456 start_codon:yes stop_codon:yes gene_type:complete
MKIGDKLKDIDFVIDDSLVLSTKDLSGKKLVVYFYPKDDTPGCTKEAIAFTDHFEKFKKLNTRIIGVSKDSAEKHKKFINKHNLKLQLATDEDLNLCKTFKVWVEKSMYGKKYMGIERATFLFDENLILIKEWRKVKVNGHAEEVLDFITN